MVVKVIDLDTEKELLVYDAYQEVLDLFSETKEEEEALEKPYMSLVTPEYLSLMTLRDKGLFIINKTNYLVVGEPEVNADEGAHIIYVEGYKATKKSPSRGKFGKK